MDPVGEPQPPKIPDFELLRRIGTGGFGDVWLARAVTGAFRAVKIVRRRPDDESAFQREFAGIRKFTEFSLGKPGQLALLHVGRDDAAGILYYVMELADDAVAGPNIDPDQYVPGTLREQVQRRGALPPAEVVRLGVDLAQALANLHDAGLVHRDVKPSNVILVGGVPKLADVGLVTEQGERRTYVGTPGYVPPEGPGLPAADVFGLGRLLYELATGNAAREFPKLPAKLPEDREGRQQFAALNSVIVRACAPDAKRRYSTAQEMLDELLLVRAERVVSRFKLRARRLRRVVAVTALVAVVALVLAQIAFRQTRRFYEETYGAKLNQANLVLAQTNLTVARLLLDTQTNRFYDVRGFEWYALSHDAGGDPPEWSLTANPPGGKLQLSPDGRLLAGLSGKSPTVTLWNLADGTPVRTVAPSLEFAWIDDAGEVRSAEPPAAARPQPTAGTPIRPSLHDPRFSWSESSTKAKPHVVLWRPGGKGPCPWQPEDAVIPGWNPGEAPFLSAASAETNPRVAVALISGRNQNARGRLAVIPRPGEPAFDPIPLDSVAAAIAISPDGTTVAVAVQGSPENLAVVEAADGRRRWKAGRHLGVVQTLAFSPDGSLLASGATDGMVIVSRADDGAVVRRIAGLDGEVMSLAWSPDGTRIVASSPLGDVRCWALDQLPPLRQATGLCRGDGGGILFSPDGTRIAASNADDSLSVFSTRDLGKRTVATGIFFPIAFLKADVLLGYSRRGQLVWHDLASHSTLRTGPSLIEGLGSDAEINVAVAVPGKGGVSVAVNATDGTDRIWDLDRLEPSHSEVVRGPQTPDGFRSNPADVSATRAGTVVFAHRWGEMRVVAVDPARVVGKWTSTADGQLYSTYADPGGQWCAVSGELGVLSRFRLPDGKLLDRLGINSQVQALAAGDDGSRLVSGNTKGEIEIAQLRPFQRITSFAATTGEAIHGGIQVKCLAFSPDQQWLAAHTTAGTLRVWDLRKSPR